MLTDSAGSSTTPTARSSDTAADWPRRLPLLKTYWSLIHGIIGDTDGMAQGLTLAKAADGKSVNEKFDLVLTYDYENLNTPISETAVKLKQQLADVGLRDDDHKRLTLLVHSMEGWSLAGSLNRKAATRSSTTW